MNATVYSLWIGDRLPRLQRLCAESWIARGCDYRLFVYRDVQGVPAGAHCMDGADFLPDVHRYADPKHAGHPALHANLFRFAWLAKYGGTWVDADTCCLQRLPRKAVIISSEPSRRPPYWHCDLAVCRVPPGAPFMLECRDEARRRLQEGERRWGRFGPKLLRDVLHRYHLDTRGHVSPPRDYCPIPCWLVRALFEPHALVAPLASYGCHLWASSAKSRDLDVDATYHPDSAFERILAAGSNTRARDTL